MFKALNIQNLKQAGEFPRFHADLTTQYSGGSPYPASLESEIRLMVMILEDAVQCYQRYFAAETDAGKSRRPVNRQRVRVPVAVIEQLRQDRAL